MQQVFEAHPATAGAIRPYNWCPYCGTAMGSVNLGDQTRQRCPVCRFTQYASPAAGAVVLIVDDRRVLLGRRAGFSLRPDTWCLPGGFMEFNENFLQTAHREVLEETGLHMRLDAIVNVVSNFLSERIHTLVIVLLAEAYSGQPAPGDDLVELRWFALDELLPSMAFEADAHIIGQYAAGKVVRLLVDPRYQSMGGE